MNPSVLIVEDDIELAEITCEMAAAVGAVAIYRTTVIDALDALSRHSTIRALVTDINLVTPMSGVDLAVFVATEWPDISICVTSGITDQAPRRLPPGATFLAKPFRSPDLVSFLQSCSCVVPGSSTI